jgi:RimJ/RimL family protein N-acetyltransferase
MSHAFWQILRAMKQPDIIFKPTSADSVAEIQRLAQDIWPNAFREILAPEQIEYMMNWMYNTEQLQREINVDHIQYDRIFVGEICCGYVAYGPGENKTVKLHKVYIHPDRQRQGLGRAALHRVSEYARQHRFGRIVLRVNRHNQRAIQAYLKYGFTVRGEDVADIGNGYVMDDFIMEYALVPDALRKPIS